MRIQYQPIHLLALSEELRLCGYTRPNAAYLVRFIEFGPTEPVLVRASAGDAGRYDILGNEKVWFAAQQAQLHEVPILEVMNLDKKAPGVDFFAAVETDDPISEAERYQSWLTNHPSSNKADLARLEGCTRTSISHRIRLLGLEPEIQTLIREYRLSTSHGLMLLKQKPGQGRVLLGIQCAQPAWSVSRLRSEVGAVETGSALITPKNLKKDPDVIRLERALSEQVGSRVAIDSTKGILNIDYCGDLNVLSGIVDRLTSVS